MNTPWIYHGETATPWFPVEEKGGEMIMAGIKNIKNLVEFL
jgi:hypothetical protein